MPTKPKKRMNITVVEFLNAVEDNRLVIMRITKHTFKIFIISSKNYHLKHVLVDGNEEMLIKGMGIDRWAECFFNLCYYLGLDHTEVKQRFQKQ